MNDPVLRIEGARTHNLKNITLEIPRDRFVVITGPSGSGKSSLAFDTIFAEGQRQYLETLSLHTRKFLRTLDRPDVDRITGLQPTVAVDQRGRKANSRSTVGTLTEIYDYLRLLYAQCGLVHCYQCGRLIRQTPPTQIIEALLNLPQNTRLILLAPQIRKSEMRLEYRDNKSHDDLFQRIIKSGFFRVRVDGQFLDLEQPPKLDDSPHDIEVVIDRLIMKGNSPHEDVRPRLAESLQLALKHGNDSMIAVYEIEKDVWSDLPFCTRYACPHCNINYTELEPRTFNFNSPYGACPACEGVGCSECHGSRLRREARNVTFADKRFYEVCAMSIEDALIFFETAGKAATEKGFLLASATTCRLPPATLLEQIIPRLEFLCRLGLSYLSLDRPTDTLSGGELQRVRLATGLGSGLTGVCYILDEPTIGLHPRDNRQLIESLKSLQQRGNMVIVVDHDEAVIKEADYRIEIGPGSGKFGGEVLDSRWQAAENRRQRSDAEGNRSGKSTCVCCHLPSDVFTLKNVATHNLKNITVSFPLQRVTCVTGVSGSGKSSLVHETLVPLVRETIKNRNVSTNNRISEPGKEPAQFPESGCFDYDSTPDFHGLIEVNQTPLGKNSRSNPATYSGLFDELRKLFASTKDAKRRGFKASRFSFNAAGGRCETCQGQGTQKVEMDYLNDYYVVCQTCSGKRFNRQTLAVKYKGKSIADVLDMSIEEAATFLENIPQCSRILQAMLKIGIGYLTLGQPSSMLSGGEAQRVKLATELAKMETGNTLYVLDEPTTGLHRFDVFRLLDVLRELTVKGNTVIVIEHNLDVMAQADWIIDLGPEGGERGGYLLATGMPEQIAALEKNETGTFLRQHIST